MAVLDSEPVELGPNQGAGFELLEGELGVLMDPPPELLDPSHRRRPVSRREDLAGAPLRRRCRAAGDGAPVQVDFGDERVAGGKEVLIGIR